MLKSLLPWRTDKAGVTNLDDLLREAHERAAEIEATLPDLRVAVLDGKDGAVGALQQAEGDVAEARATADRLVALQAAAADREAKRVAALAAKRREALTVEIESDLKASAEAAGRLTKHLALAVQAFKDLVKAREAVPRRGLGINANIGLLHRQAIRILVAAEQYRVGAELNDTLQNYGWPSTGLDGETSSFRGALDKIPSLSERLARIDKWIVNQARGVKAPAVDRGPVRYPWQADPDWTAHLPKPPEPETPADGPLEAVQREANAATLSQLDADEAAWARAIDAKAEELKADTAAQARELDEAVAKLKNKPK